MSNFFGWMRPKPKKDETPPSEKDVRAQYGTLEIKVNGVPVTEVSDMKQCYALKNKNGHSWYVFFRMLCMY